MRFQFVHPIQRATHRIALYLDELKVEGLTQGEAHILALLTKASPLSVGELHLGLAHRRSTLTSILDRLTKRRLITRQIRETDRRSFSICLTAKGRKLAQRISKHLASLERKLKGRVTAADIKGFEHVIFALENLQGR